MTREEGQLGDIVAHIIEARRSQVRINPSWIATEALKEIDPANRSVELVSLGCHLQLRQIARAQCRKLFEDGGGNDEEPTFSEFEQLQWRYPAARTGSKKDDPEYVLRDYMTDDDIAYNIDRLRSEALNKGQHRVTGCRDDASRATVGLPSAADAPLQRSELAKSASKRLMHCSKKSSQKDRVGIHSMGYVDAQQQGCEKLHAHRLFRDLR